MHLTDNWKSVLTDRCKAAALVFLFYLLLTHFTGCPVRFLTGISCPGCGMTRAWLSLLHLDLAGAIACHPLFWTAPGILFLFLFAPWIDSRRLSRALLLLALLFLLVYLLRMTGKTDTIVVFSPKKGLIGRILLKFLPISPL